MGFGDAFRELGDFLDECGRRERALESVEVTGCGESAPGEGPTVDVEVTLTAGRPGTDGCLFAASSPHIDADGTVSLELESREALVPTEDCDVHVASTGATVDDGTVSVAFEATVPADGHGTSGRGGSDASVDADTGNLVDSGDSHENGEGATASVGERDVPPFKDQELLADVYESCDTFAEMADTLGMDVTAETVRRYMIDYDIHQPDSYQTGTDGDGGRDGRAGIGEADQCNGRAAVDETGTDQPVALSDGIGLPDEVTVDTLIETVERSNTIYEVKQDIGIDRQDALDMLQNLNLLDLVVGRLATEAERDISREDVVERLREASATQ